MPTIMSTLGVAPSSIRSGFRKAASPSTPSTLKRSLPISVPTISSVRPRRAAMSAVASSGSEGPPATMVTPIAHSDMPKVPASETADRTSR